MKPAPSPVSSGKAAPRSQGQAAESKAKAPAPRRSAPAKVKDNKPASTDSDNTQQTRERERARQLLSFRYHLKHASDAECDMQSLTRRKLLGDTKSLVEWAEQASGGFTPGPDTKKGDWPATWVDGSRSWNSFVVWFRKWDKEWRAQKEKEKKTGEKKRQDFEQDDAGAVDDAAAAPAESAAQDDQSHKTPASRDEPEKADRLDEGGSSLPGRENTAEECSEEGHNDNAAETTSSLSAATAARDPTVTTGDSILVPDQVTTEEHQELSSSTGRITGVSKPALPFLPMPKSPAPAGPRTNHGAALCNPQQRRLVFAPLDATQAPPASLLLSAATDFVAGHDMVSSSTRVVEAAAPQQQQHHGEVGGQFDDAMFERFFERARGAADDDDELPNLDRLDLRTHEEGRGAEADARDCRGLACGSRSCDSCRRAWYRWYRETQHQGLRARRRAEELSRGGE